MKCLFPSPAAVLAAASFACGTLCGQTTAYTDPVGYETLVAFAGPHNLFGLRLHQPTMAAGILEIGPSTLYAPSINFDAILDPAKKYLVELIGGASAGEVLEITSFAMNTLIVSKPLPLETNVPFRIRLIPKLSEVLPKAGVFGTDDFNPDHADLILLPKESGGFDSYFLSTHTSLAHPEYQDAYVNVATGQPEDPHVFYTKAFFYLRRGGATPNHVISGALKMHSNTWLSVSETFNYFSSVYPVGVTLGSSGLASALQTGTAATADVVWMQDETGAWRKYFHSNGTPPLSAGWREVGAPAGQENTDQADVPLSAGFAIHRRSLAPYRVLLTPPEFYFGP